jgi:hypothetical protein
VDHPGPPLPRHQRSRLTHPYAAAGFGDGENALVAEALRLLQPLGPPLAAYLGGSRAFGLGNALSDVDLTVVYDTLPPGVPRERSVDGPGISLHCEVVRLADLAPLADLFANDALPVETTSLSADAVVSAHRKTTELLRGRYLSTSPEVEALRARLDGDTVDRLSAAAAAALGTLYVRDAAGAARSGDWLTAAAAAEMALEYAFDTALFAAGDPYRSRKFLPRRLSRHEHLAPYLDAWRRIAAEADDLERRTRATLLLANGLQAATLLGTGDVWTDERQGDGPRRSPYVSLLVTDAGLRLAGEVERDLVRPAALVWLLADGRPAGELATGFADLTGLDSNDVGRFVDDAVASLAANGVLDSQA